MVVRQIYVDTIQKHSLWNSINLFYCDSSVTVTINFLCASLIPHNFDDIEVLALSKYAPVAVGTEYWRCWGIYTAALYGICVRVSTDLQELNISHLPALVLKGRKDSFNWNENVVPTKSKSSAYWMTLSELGNGVNQVQWGWWRLNNLKHRIHFITRLSCLWVAEGFIIEYMFSAYNNCSVCIYLIEIMSIHIDPNDKEITFIMKYDYGIFFYSI